MNLSKQGIVAPVLPRRRIKKSGIAAGQPCGLANASLFGWNGDGRPVVPFFRSLKRGMERRVKQKRLEYNPIRNASQTSLRAIQQAPGEIALYRDAG